jgi:hypothetical protein
MGLLKTKQVNDRMRFKYPVHGDILSNERQIVDGVVEALGKGPNGPHVTIKEKDGDGELFRCFSEWKIEPE